MAAIRSTLKTDINDIFTCIGFSVFSSSYLLTSAGGAATGTYIAYRINPAIGTLLSQCIPHSHRTHNDKHGINSLG